MSALEGFTLTHRGDCDRFRNAPCNCGRDDATAELALLKSRLFEAVALLKESEWKAWSEGDDKDGDPQHYCWCCQRWAGSQREHESSCKLAMLLEAFQ